MNHAKKRNTVLALITATQVALGAPPSGYIYPEAEWVTASPESQGVNSIVLNDAVNNLKKKMNADEVLVVRRGRVIHRGSKSKSQHRVWSAAKSFTSTVLGVLIDQKKLTIDEKAHKFESSLKSKYPNVTFRHFATMTSGYDAQGGSYGPGSQDGSSTPFKVANPLFSPGTHTSYWDDAMNMFGQSLSKVAGKNFALVFDAEIAKKIGIKKYKWPVAFSGVSSGSGNKAGLEISADEMARLGHLFLSEGNWNGVQVLSREWVRDASQIQVSASVPSHKTTQNTGLPGKYGYNWWVNGPQKKIFSSATEKTFSAIGAKGNYCIIIPEWDMVIVRLGTEGTSAPMNEFLKKLSTGIK